MIACNSTIYTKQGIKYIFNKTQDNILGNYRSRFSVILSENNRK